MTWYKTGTVAVTPGSNAVLGTGTSFIANSRVGDAFRGPDGEWYEVTNIASDTAISIAPNYQGVAEAAGGYSLAPMQGYVKDSADALRAATQVIASGVADMQEQVAAATEAATSAGQSKTVATEQAGIATAAAEASSDNKDATQLSAQQSQASAQEAGAAATRSETARDSVIQSEQAAAASAAAAAASAAHAEEVTIGKAASGDNNDITSLRALTADGFDRIRQGIAPFAGATASLAGTKGLVPAPSIADRLKVLRGDGTYVALPTGAAWGAITGTLSAQTDLKAALDLKVDAASQSGGWITATLLNGWVTYDAASQPVQYRKIGTRVDVRGDVRAGTADPIFNLPAEYRPLKDQLPVAVYAAQSFAGGAMYLQAANGAFGRSTSSMGNTRIPFCVSFYVD